MTSGVPIDMPITVGQAISRDMFSCHILGRVQGAGNNIYLIQARKCDHTPLKLMEQRFDTQNANRAKTDNPAIGQRR